MSITLPWPPGVNNLFATYRNRRIRTRRYEAWLSEAAAALVGQRWTAFDAPARVSIALSPPDRRERDADGFIKAPIDFLVKAGVLAGDSMRFIRSVSAEWSDAPPAKPGSVTVSIRPAAEAAPCDQSNAFVRTVLAAGDVQERARASAQATTPEITKARP